MVKTQSGTNTTNATNVSSPVTHSKQKSAHSDNDDLVPKDVRKRLEIHREIALNIVQSI